MSKTADALVLCDKLLRGIESGRLTCTDSLRLLRRVVILLERKDLEKVIKLELEGYFVSGPRGDIEKLFEIELPKKASEFGCELDQATVGKSARELVDQFFPSYRFVTVNNPLTGRPDSFVIGMSIPTLEETHGSLRASKHPRWVISHHGVNYDISISDTSNLIERTKTWVHNRAAEIWMLSKFDGVPEGIFEEAKRQVDRALPRLCPEAIPQIEAISSNLTQNNPENWSNATTSCRRLLKAVADKLFPPQDTPVKGRAVKDGNYINRLWAYMDLSIANEGNRQHRKTTVDYLGHLLKQTDELAQRGTHKAQVSCYDAKRCVIFTYLVLADMFHLTSNTSL